MEVVNAAEGKGEGVEGEGNVNVSGGGDEVGGSRPEQRRS